MITIGPFLVHEANSKNKQTGLMSAGVYTFLFNPGDARCCCLVHYCLYVLLMKVIIYKLDYF